MAAGGSRDARVLPTGEVTFLFTDVESSTVLWEREPETMAAALADHDEMLYRAVEDHGGVVFKGVGDGICAVFDTARNAVAGAVDGQCCLLTHPWGASGPLRVRMALHTGPAQLRAGDYFGTTLNRTARLMATAHGGQVVLSEAATRLAADHLPPGVSLSDLGMHRLKDLSRPEHVFQLNHPDLPGEFAPLRSLEWHLGNLPHRLTEFIGRHAEIAQLRDLVGSHRLVTLAGVGGIGKTSLALRAAAEGIDDFSDGAWLIELAPLTDGTQIPGATAQVLGVETMPSQDVTAALIRHLEGLETLLVLDNCEHVVDAAAGFVDTLLHATEHLRVLATSREPLRIDGETVLRVPPLELPTADAPFDEFLDIEAVALFTDRAQLTRPGFAVDESSAAAVIDICRRLDGIPLAIELAAARLDTMTTTQLAERLDDRFGLLTRGSRAALPRQQTLQGLIDWSHDLLTEPEQILLRRLGAFGASFTLHAAQQVCGFEPLQPSEIGERLDRLTETSLVLAPEPPSDRYRMLETIRAYARGHLDGNAETDPTMRRLAAYLLEAGPPTDLGLAQSDYLEWLQWRAAEQDNFRAALEWARTTNNGLLCGALGLEFYSYLADNSLVDEAEAWVESALDLLPDEPTQLRLRILTKLASSAIETIDHARALLSIGAMRTDAEVLGDEAAIAWALVLEARVTAEEGDLDSALAMNQQGMELLLAAGDLRFEGAILYGMDILLELGLYDEAETLVTRLESARTAFAAFVKGDHRIRAFRGTIAIWRGDYDQAVGLFESCIEPAREWGARELGAMLVQLGRAEFGRDSFVAAHELLQEGTAQFSERDVQYISWLPTIAALIELEIHGTEAATPHLLQSLDAGAVPYGIAREEVLTVVGEVAFAAERPREATVFHAAAAAEWERTPGLVPEYWVRRRHGRAVEQLRQTLGAETFDRLYEQGKNLSYDQAAQRARALLDEALRRAPGPMHDA